MRMITEAKMTLPVLKADLFPRPALLGAIRNGLDKRLILLIADPGYGKTTTLTQIAARDQLPHVYYALGVGDSDPATFMAHIIHGIEKLSPGALPRTKRIMRTLVHDRGYGRAVAAALLNELHVNRREELFLLLDDYHAIAAKSRVHDVVDFMIQSLPAYLHVIIASRALPRLPTLAKWIACGDAIHFTKRELGFSEQELRSWLPADTHLPAGEVRKLVALTDGWPIGIKHVVDQLRGEAISLDAAIRRLTETERPVHRYFLEEILNLESSATRTFLATTSILDEMDPAICDHLTGSRTAAAILDHLYHHNLFVDKVGAAEYRYHPLFRDFLRLRIGNKARQNALLQRAAEYHEMHGSADAAIRYWMRAGRIDNGLRQLNGLVERGEEASLSDFDAWLKGVAIEQVERYPAILIEWGARMRDAGDYEQSQTLFLKAERRLAGPRGAQYARLMYERALTRWRQNDNKGALAFIGKSLRAAARSGGRARMLRTHADIHNLAGMLWLSAGGLHRARRHLAIAKAVMHRMGDTIAVRNIDANIAMHHALQGSVSDALVAFKDCMGVKADDASWPEIGLVAYNAVRIALINGDTAWAAQCLRRAEEACRDPNETATAASLQYAAALLHLYGGEWQQAEDCFQRAYTAYCTIGWLTSQCMLLRDWGRLCRYQGDLTAAAGHIDRALALVTEPSSALGIGAALEQALRLHADGRIAAADALVRQCIANAKARRNRMSLFLSLLTAADLAASRGRDRPAAMSLRRALMLSRRHGYDGLLGVELRYRPSLAGIAGQNAQLRPLLKGLKPGIRNDGPRPAAQHLCIKLFGQLRMATPAGLVIPLRWRSRKARSLFAYLLVQRDRRCASDRLMEQFWPDEQAERANENLRSAIFRIKDAVRNGLRVAGKNALAKTELIVHAEKSYGIARSLDLTLDVEEFTRRHADGRRRIGCGQVREGLSEYQEGVDLYGDPFMADCGEPWCADLRQGYEHAFLEMLEALIKDANAHKDHHRAITLCERYLLIEPFNEGIHLEYWEALRGGNNRQKIKEDYQRLTVSLRRELHAQPDQRTVRTYQELMGR